MNPAAGNGDNAFATTVDLPDDADPPAASTFNVASGGLCDRTATLSNGWRAEIADLATLKAINTTSTANGATRVVKGFGVYTLDKSVNPTWTEDLPLVVAPTVGSGRWFAKSDVAAEQYVQSFSTAGTTSWMCPPNLILVDVELVGGGGGGGGGAGSSAATGDPSGGGGGGAGARVLATKQTSPGQQHDAIVGAGGTGGAAGAAGSDGVASSLGVHGVGPFISALGGQGGTGTSTAFGDNAGASALAATTPGGQGVTGTPKSNAFAGATFAPAALIPGGGGYATNETSSNASYNTTAGSPNALGFAGGAAGARGTSLSHHGGGGGGGGGGGAYGVGGPGGAGGNSGAGGTQTNGSGGTAAANNTGAGGGGGGGGAAGTVPGTSTGAAGGPGGSGVLIIRGRAVA